MRARCCTAPGTPTAPGHGCGLELAMGPSSARTLGIPSLGGRQGSDESSPASIHETVDIVDALRARFPDLKGPGRSDICYATQNRQDGVKRLVEEGISQLLVVGSANSSNSQRLCEVAKKSGVPAELLGRVDELPEDILFREGLVGLTAGASAPEYLVIDIVNKFRENNWDIRELVVMEEDISFDIPATIKE